MTLERRAKTVTALAIAPQAPLLVDHQTPVATTIERMRTGHTSCALVMRDESLIGIFTARDVLEKFFGNSEAPSLPVAALMTPDPVFLAEAASIHEAAVLMQRGGFRHVPIVGADGAPVGVVRHKDVIAYLVENFADRALNLPPDPDQIATKPEGA